MTASMHVINGGEPHGKAEVVLTLPVAPLRDRSYTDPETGKQYRDFTRCRVCRVEIGDGELVRFRADRPLHPACYEQVVGSLSMADAWVAVAEDVKRNPSKHTAATVRAVLENLSALVQASSRRGELTPDGEKR